MRRWSLRRSQVPWLSRPYSDFGELSERWCRWKSLHGAEVARSWGLPPSALQLPCEIPPVGGPGLVVFAVCSRASSPVFPVSPPLLSLSPFPWSCIRCWDMCCCRSCLQVTSSWWLLPLVQVWSCSSFSTVGCLLRVCACGGQRAMVNCCGWCELRGVVVAA